MPGFKNEKYSGFGAALQKSSAKKKLKEEKESKQPEKKKEKKTDWKKYFRLGSGGRSKTSAQE
tara:strand:+ start:235 stop:423 length:189 start_codon:yes stop_codon:yes gene_type:complete